MKFFYASTILIGAALAAASSSNKNSSASAGLRRGQQRRQKNERRTQGPHGLFGGMDDSQASFFDGGLDMLFGGSSGGSMMGNSNDCGSTCDNPEVCDSFVSLAAMFDPTSVFKDACNAGCFPQERLEHCNVVCGTSTATSTEQEQEGVSLETESAVSSAIARAGFIDVMAAKETMCGDCKFYSCCVDSNVAADPTKYDACSVHLDENLQHQAIGDSLLEEIFGSVSDTLNQVMEDVAEVVDTVMQDLDITDALQVAEEEDGALDTILSQVVDSFAGAMEVMSEELENINLEEQWSDFSISDWGDGAVWSGIEDASGLSIFGQVAGSFTCPETCEEEKLCKDVFVGLADQTTLENACNSNCLPAPGSCKDICGNADGPQFLAAITSMACDSCKFFECCSEEAQGDDPKFNSCQVHLPDTVDLLSDIAFDGSEVQEWIDSIDLSTITEDLNLVETFENLQTLFDETMANFESFPVTCNPDTCPVSGLCDMNINMASLDLDEICMEGALFKCGDGLKTMCTEECNSPHSSGFAPMCALCNVATCCETSKVDGKSFQDCAMGALTMDDVTQDMIGGSVDTPTENLAPDESEALIAPSPSITEEVVSSTSTTPDEEEDVPSEQQLDGAVPAVEFQANIAEVNRVENIPESGAYARQATVTAAFASLAAMFFASV